MFCYHLRGQKDAQTHPSNLRTYYFSDTLCHSSGLAAALSPLLSKWMYPSQVIDPWLHSSRCGILQSSWLQSGSQGYNIPWSCNGYSARPTGAQQLQVVLGVLWPVVNIQNSFWKTRYWFIVPVGRAGMHIYTPNLTIALSRPLLKKPHLKKTAGWSTASSSCLTLSFWGYLHIHPKIFLSLFSALLPTVVTCWNMCTHIHTSVPRQPVEIRGWSYNFKASNICIILWILGKGWGGKLSNSFLCICN